jgi:peroxiredoxin
MAEVRSTFLLRPGMTIPGFTLPDPDGVPHTLRDIQGPRGTLVVFACNHCPYVIHLAGALGEIARNLRTDGIHTVAINSNDFHAYPADAPAAMRDFQSKHRWDFPYLVDESQETARTFGAACTPDFFLFDESGALHYTGQIDETRPRSETPAHGADLIQAAKCMLAGEPAANRQYPSSGCNIKWKPGTAPDWWNSGK